MSDKFTWKKGDAELVTPELCPNCKHLRDARRWTCAAYPDGIPAAILVNRVDHRQPYRGDNGIRYEPKRLD